MNQIYRTGQYQCEFISGTDMSDAFGSYIEIRRSHDFLSEGVWISMREFGEICTNNIIYEGEVYINIGGHDVTVVNLTSTSIIPLDATFWPDEPYNQFDEMVHETRFLEDTISVNPVDARLNFLNDVWNISVYSYDYLFEEYSTVLVRLRSVAFDTEHIIMKCSRI